MDTETAIERLLKPTGGRTRRQQKALLIEALDVWRQIQVEKIGETRNLVRD